MTNYDRLSGMTREQFNKWLDEEYNDNEGTEQFPCPYCTLDENLECLQEHFESPNGDLEVDFSCGGAEVSISVSHNGSKGIIVTSGKYCAYCGRKIAD